MAQAVDVACIDLFNLFVAEARYKIWEIHLSEDIEDDVSIGSMF